MNKITCVKNKVSISILIPCYNWDIYDLVSSLHEICAQNNRLDDFEIFCLEDGSKQYFSNAKITNIKHVKYERLASNIGRSKIRNLMAQRASYDWLLFIDADSKVINKNFIQNYIDNIPDQIIDKNIYYGTTAYVKQKPLQNKQLHWLYGSRIESKRKKDIFCSHHFLIAKKHFTQDRIQFNEQISSYGYEDVFFVLENKLNPIYIQNPLLHIGIKTNSEFINHTEQALENLNKHYKRIENTQHNIKILRYKKILSMLMLTYPVIILFKTCKLLILKNLNSTTPLIWLFQFYKIGYFLNISSES